MNPAFDIAEDELEVLLSEADEQLQTLDAGLVRLERHADAALVQALFRAAHTLKGMAGVINHFRMADLTHALETVLDSLRQGTLTATPELVDACLDALDALKSLRYEITGEAAGPVEVEPLVARLLAFGEALETPPAPPMPEPLLAPMRSVEGEVRVCADISPESMAPAARAFQIMLALQNLGAIQELRPTQAEIEAGAPGRRVTARLATTRSLEQVRRALSAISEIAQLTLNDEVVPLARPAPLVPSAPPNGGDGNGALSAAPPRIVEKVVRARVEQLDSLMNLVGELITDRNRLTQLQREAAGALAGRLNGHLDDLGQTIVHLSRLTDQLQEEVMHLRLVPIAGVFNKFPRLVRDLARKAEKQVELVVRGEDTELDRSVIEEITDPLIHLIRNAVDHGLEPPAERVAQGKAERGILLLTARHEENRIVLTVEDDGRGIDPQAVKAAAVARGLLTEAEAAGLSRDEAIQLIFRPGLSTAKTVTEVSGRGVGMDIVRTNLEKLNGNIVVETWAGQGTRFQISLPLTLAIIPSLLVRVGGATYAIPLITVMEVLRLAPAEIQTVRGRPVTKLRGRVLPLLSLAEVYALASAPRPAQAYEYVVAARWGKLEMGLRVDALIGEQEIVVKPLGALVGDSPGVSGASILGDGRIALIVDVPGLFQLTGVLGATA